MIYYLTYRREQHIPLEVEAENANEAISIGWGIVNALNNHDIHELDESDDPGEMDCEELNAY